MAEARATQTKRRGHWVVDTVRRVADTLDTSAKARRATMALCGVLAYLILGHLIDPGFTDYWWYQVFQTSVTLLVVVGVETEFAEEGGLAWQALLIIVLATLADTLGTAGHLYHSWAPYDKVVHFTSGAVFAVGFYEVLGFLVARGRITLTNTHRALLAWALSLLIAGIVWESYEQMSDALFRSGRVHGRADTIGDLIADALGAVAGLAVVIYRRRGDAVEGQLGDQ